MAMSELSQEILKRADAIGVWANGSLDKIGEGVGKVSQIAYEQAIEIAKQYILFGTVYLTCIVVFGAILTVVGGYLLSKITFEDETTIIHFFLGLASSVIGLITFLVNFKEMIMVWAAPKMWLIMQLTELAKTAKQASGV